MPTEESIKRLDKESGTNCWHLDSYEPHEIHGYEEHCGLSHRSSKEDPCWGKVHGAGLVNGADFFLCGRHEGSLDKWDSEPISHAGKRVPWSEL